MVNRIGRSLLLGLVALAFVPALPANNIYNTDSDAVFDSGFGLFYAGPQWLLNALPGSVSDRVAHARVARVPFDRDGDRVESLYRYANDVGTLTSPFNVSLFNNVIFFATGGTSKVSSPRVADLSPSVDFAWNQTTGGKWSLATNWTPTALVGGPDAPGIWVTVNTNIAAAATITVYDTADPGDSIKTIGRLDIGDTDNTSKFTIDPGTGNGVLNFDGNGANAQLNELSTSAGDTISAPITLTTSLDITNASANTLTLSGAISAATSGTKTVTASSGLVSISGNITNGSGTVGVTKSGTGTLTLSGTNSFTGGLKIQGGTVSVSSSSNLGGTTNGITMDGGTLLFTAGFTTGTGRTINVTSNGGTFDVAGGTTISGNVTNGTGAGSSTILKKVGTNQLVLSGDNSGYTGQWDISVGNLAIAAANSINSSNAVTLSSTGGFRIQGVTATIGNLNGSGTGTIQNTTGTGTLVVTQTTDGSISNNIVTGAGTMNLTKSGSAKLTLTGSNTFNGATLITNGTLEAAANGALGSGTTGTSGITVNAGGTLLLSNTTATDRVRNDAPVVLNSGNGTPNTGGHLVLGTTNDAANTSETMGALTLNNNSTIDFASTSTSHFALTLSGTSTLAATPSNYALVMHWDGTIGQVGTTGSADRLIFAAVNDGTTAFTNGSVTNALLFDIGGQLYNTEFLTTAGGLEAVPFQAVPEPSTWIGASLALAAIGWTQRKRVSRVFQGA